MRHALLCTLLLVVGFSTGCQSEEEGIRWICNAPRECTECARVSPAERNEVLARTIDEGLRNAEARALFESLFSVDPATRSERLSERARALGITDCPMAERWRPEDMESP